METFHWESQPTCISPLPFDLDGASYVLEMNCSVVDPTLATSFMVVWRHDDFERQRSSR